MLSILLPYPWYLIPALVAGSAVAWFLRDRLKWDRVDALWLLGPGILWIALVVTASLDKSLANLVELPILGVLAGPFLYLRVSLQRRFAPRRAALAVFGLYSATAVSFWLLFPGLPE